MSTERQNNVYLLRRVAERGEFGERTGLIGQSRVRLHAVVAQCGMHGLIEGVQLFNKEQFFEAHEVLEDVWRASAPNDKKFLQGLTQLAVAFHHHTTGNDVGCRSVLARALRNLSAYPEGLFGLHTSEIVERVAPCQQALDENKAFPALPKLEIHRD